jgi:hypothetical protein
MALKQIAGRVAIKMPRLSGIRTRDCDQGPRAQLKNWSEDAEFEALDGARKRSRRGAESSGRTHGTVARDAHRVGRNPPAAHRG